MSVVRVENLTKVYGKGENEVKALRGVNLTVKPGEFLAITGASGSGKSTLMHLIGGLDRPTDGAVWLGETKLSDMNDKELSRLRRKKIGFVFQFFNLLPVLTARENVAMPLLLDGVKRAAALEQADKMLDTLGLSERKHHRPSALSGGQQQRVSLARALVIQPALILGDEPTGALDTRTSDDVVALLGKIAREWNRTVILVTHDPRVAANADRIVYIKDGQIVDDHQLQGSERRTTAEIRQQFARIEAQ